MKKKTIALGSGIVALLVVIGAVRQIMAHRTEVIELPWVAVQQAVDEVISDRESEAEELQRTDEAFIRQSERLMAHDTVRVALSEWRGLRDAETCARAKELESKLISWRRQTGKSLEEILSLELAAHLERLSEWNRKTPGISGDAEAIAATRAMRGDTEALLYLADTIYSGESLPLCEDNFAREVARMAQVFDQVQARVATTEENLERLRREELARAQEVWNRNNGETPRAPQGTPQSEAPPPSDQGQPAAAAEPPANDDGLAAFNELLWGSDSDD